MNMQHIRAVFVCIDVVYGMVDSLYFNHSHCHVRAALQYVLCTRQVRVGVYNNNDNNNNIGIYVCVFVCRHIYIYVVYMVGLVHAACIYKTMKQTEKKSTPTQK